MASLSMVGVLCDICGKSFKSVGNLNRHRKSHEGGGDFPCTSCEKVFSRKDVLTKHLNAVHGVTASAASTEEKIFACSVCSKSYGQRKNLLRHMRSEHAETEAENSPDNVQDAKRPRLQCTDCDNSFAHAHHLSAHVRAKHPHQGLSTGNMECPKCDDCFPSMQSLRSHLTALHDYVDESETLHFESMGRFQVWKEEMERERVCHFVKYCGGKAVGSGKRHYFVCHRSGVFVSRVVSGSSSRVRHQPTVKIGGACPAGLVVTEDEEAGTVSVTRHMNHLGHACSVKYLKLTDTERQILEGKLRQGVSFERILDDLRDSVLEQEDLRSFTRFHLTDRRDLWNLLRKIDIKGEQAHQSDAVSVDMIVQELRAKGHLNPVLFYKPQDRPCCPCDSPLADEDFMLVLCTKFQAEHLSHLLTNKVMMDSTHGTNPYDFQLTVVVSVDEFGSGVPIAFCVSNRTNVVHMSKFLAHLKARIGGAVHAKVFMSDMAPSSYNAWEAVMGPAENRLHCTWHVDKAWRENIMSRVKCPNKRAEVYRACRSLMGIPEEELFRICMAGFLDMLKEDQDTADFGVYFKDNYENSCQQWAFCFRSGLGLNTNMFVESLFKKIKYIYLQGKDVRRLDKCLSALLRVARDLGFDRVRKLMKGSDSTRQASINRSHNTCVQTIQPEMVTLLEPGSRWEVASCTVQGVRYKIQSQENLTCAGGLCGLVCFLCKVCVHQFECECEDFQFRSNMCKHIHACVLYGTPSAAARDDPLLDNIEEAMEAVSGTVARAGRVGGTVSIDSKWRTISTNIGLLMQRADVNDVIVEGGMRFLELLRRELPRDDHVSSVEEEVVQEDTPDLASLALMTPKRNRTTNAIPSPAGSPTLSVLGTPPRTPTNRTVTPQRQLKYRSTKGRVGSSSQVQQLTIPTLTQTGAFIKNFLGGDRDGIVNVHTEGDHSYN